MFSRTAPFVGMRRSSTHADCAIIAASVFSASGAEAQNDTDGRSADPNLLWDKKRSKMLLFFDTRNPNQTSWVTSSTDGVQWTPAIRVNTGYNTVRPTLIFPRRH